MLTTTRRIHHAAIVCALGCALFASSIGTATAASSPAGEQAYVRGVASLDFEQIAAAYNPAWRGEESSATVVEELGPRERQYVQGILRLTPEQLRAGFGTVEP